jgi:hypothetical protein
MPYSTSTIYAINRGPRSLGNKLGRLAIALDFSVLRIAKATGATRQTVYNWMVGGEVLTPYRPRVEQLTDILRDSKSAEEAWTKTCAAFNLQA